MLHVHRAERADGLVDGLRELLLAPPADPFAREVVAVPTRGIERWLAQRLSGGLGTSPGRGDGICANVAFPSPRALTGEAVAAASGIDPEADPWVPERSVWPLLDVVDAALDEPWLARLAAHLRAGAAEVRAARRFAGVCRVAELFDRYALHRPDMVRAWARGEDADGAGRPLRPEAAWQAELWRRLDAALDVPGPAERLADACAALRARPDLLELPERVGLFGLTRLPAGHLEVLAALAAGRDVHLFVLHPSPALWERVAALPPVRHRAQDGSGKLPRNPLLASWGQDVRELQLVIAAAGEHADRHHPSAAAATPETLLERLQAAVRADA
ncbi:MAG TPA: exodeoxyribonuclease V subunit gamma, partial [Solirubrobacteraceae bacterium]